jgi:hypothetical protein
LIAEQAIGLNLPDAHTIHRSNISRRPAKKSTSPSSACRSCAAALSSACSWCRTARKRNYTEEEEEALQTTAMVLAEVIASGELQGSGARGGDRRRPHAQPQSALRDAGRRHRAWAGGVCMSRASRSEPHCRGASRRKSKRLEDAVEQLRAQVDELLDGSDAMRATDYSDVLETIRMFAHDKGWVNRLQGSNRIPASLRRLPWSACRTTTAPA